MPIGLINPTSSGRCIFRLQMQIGDIVVHGDGEPLVMCLVGRLALSTGESVGALVSA